MAPTTTRPADKQRFHYFIREVVFGQLRKPYISNSSSGWWFGTFLFFPILGIIIPTDQHFAEGWLNHQPVMDFRYRTYCDMLPTVQGRGPAGVTAATWFFLIAAISELDSEYLLLREPGQPWRKILSANSRSVLAMVDHAGAQITGEFLP